MTGSVSSTYRTPGVSWPRAIGTASGVLGRSSDADATASGDLSEEVAVPHAVANTRRTDPRILDIGHLDGLPAVVAGLLRNYSPRGQGEAVEACCPANFSPGRPGRGAPGIGGRECCPAEGQR